MDRAALADELRRARFRTTQLREGYAEGAVDDLVDEVVRQLLSPDADPRSDADIVAMVDAARPPTTTLRRGYAQADVDALLRHVVDSLGGTWTPRPTDRATDGATDGAAAPPPSAVTEPPRGLLSRILGR